jgi:hypothetical protein
VAYLGSGSGCGRCYRPSGDQAGGVTDHALDVSSCSPLPSAFTTYCSLVCFGRATLGVLLTAIFELARVESPASRDSVAGADAVPEAAAT